MFCIDIRLTHLVNPGKLQVMFLKNNHEVESSVEGMNLKPCTYIKLLGVTIDRKLNFRSHVEALCTNASQKVKASLRIRPYLNLQLPYLKLILILLSHQTIISY